MTVTSAVLRPALHLTDAGPILFQANEAYWQSRRLVTVAACVGEADDGLSLPAIAMTAAERDCCKRMAGDCGHKGKAQSHSCCQTIRVPDHLAAIKSSSVVNWQHPTMLVAYQVHPGLTIPAVPEFGLALLAVDIHSPPVSPPVVVPFLEFDLVPLGADALVCLHDSASRDLRVATT